LYVDSNRWTISIAPFNHIRAQKIEWRDRKINRREEREGDRVGDRERELERHRRKRGDGERITRYGEIWLCNIYGGGFKVHPKNWRYHP
jgi:hypothetical protein